MLMMRRRDLISLLGCTVAWPLIAHAQQRTQIFRLGYLSPLSASSDSTRYEALLLGLQRLGYIEGKNTALERRYADGRVDRLPALANELGQLKVHVIVAAGGSFVARSVKDATTTIPIVMTNAEDPVAERLVTNLARPGGNVTGLTTFSPDLSAKRLEIFKETIPSVTNVAVLWNPDVIEKLSDFAATQMASRSLGVTLQSFEVRSSDELESIFVEIANRGAQALVTLQDPLTNTHRNRIAMLATDSRLPTMFASRSFVDAGGLVSYGPDYADLFRRAAIYIDKILTGAAPADLPIEQPTKFELVINLKTAKALGITIPQSLLQRADEVIE